MDMFRMVHAGVCVVVALTAVASLFRAVTKGKIGFYGQGFDRKIMPVSFTGLVLAYVVMLAAAGYWAYLDITGLLHAGMR